MLVAGEINLRNLPTYDNNLAVSRTYIILSNETCLLPLGCDVNEKSIVKTFICLTATSRVRGGIYTMNNDAHLIRNGELDSSDSGCSSERFRGFQKLFEVRQQGLWLQKT